MDAGCVILLPSATHYSQSLLSLSFPFLSHLSPVPSICAAHLHNYAPFVSTYVPTMAGAAETAAATASVQRKARRSGMAGSLAPAQTKSHKGKCRCVEPLVHLLASHGCSGTCTMQRTEHETGGKRTRAKREKEERGRKVAVKSKSKNEEKRQALTQTKITRAHFRVLPARTLTV